MLFRSSTTTVGTSRSPGAAQKRPFREEDESPASPFVGPTCKRRRLPEPSEDSSPSQSIPPQPLTRPWKDVYSERLKVAKNWRHGRCSVRTLKGHTNGVMCLQYSETLSHPNFPILMTGSFDRTVRIWNMETSRQIGCLHGHQRAIRALQFDEAKLITASMDKTLKIWNWRTGECTRTLQGHTEGVIALAFDDDVLVSGSADATVKIWNFRTCESHTLRGHRDWINAVVLWDGRPVSPSSHAEAMETRGSPGPDLGARKLVFSASDDGAIRLWDLSTRECIRELTGHMAQVQSIKLAYVEGDDDGDDGGNDTKSIGCLKWGPPVTRPVTHWEDKAALVIDAEEPTSTVVGEQAVHRKRGPHAVLISGSLDNTMKMWDIESGTCLKTYFGHIEGLWGVAVDTRHIVSASHDRTIKVTVRFMYYLRSV